MTIKKIADMFRFMKTGNRKPVLGQEGELLFGKLFKYAPVCIEVYDRQGIMRDVNPAYERLWNVSGDSSIGKYNILEDGRLKDTRFLQCVQEAYKKGYNLSTRHAFNIPTLESMTEPKNLKTKILPIKNVHGNVEQVMVIHEEIEDKIEV